MMIFVYGTLKRGFHNNHYLHNSYFVGDAETEEQFTLMDLGHFPGIVPGDKAIKGELYIIDEITLAKLDRLEGEGVLYKRTPITVWIGAVDYACETYVLMDRYGHELEDCTWGSHGEAFKDRR